MALCGSTAANQLSRNARRRLGAMCFSAAAIAITSRQLSDDHSSLWPTMKKYRTSRKLQYIYHGKKYCTIKSSSCRVPEGDRTGQDHIHQPRSRSLPAKWSCRISSCADALLQLQSHAYYLAALKFDAATLPSLILLRQLSSWSGLVVTKEWINTCFLTIKQGCPQFRTHFRPARIRGQW